MAKLIVLPDADYQQFLYDVEGNDVVILTTQKMLDEASISLAEARRQAATYDPSEADVWVELVGRPEHPFLEYVRSNLPS